MNISIDKNLANLIIVITVMAVSTALLIKGYIDMQTYGQIMVAAVSYYFGYGMGQFQNPYPQPSPSPQPSPMEIRHLRRKYIRRICYVFLGAGISLIIEHLVTYGRFDWGDWLGHEWIGLYMVIASMLAIAKLSQRKHRKHK